MLLEIIFPFRSPNIIVIIYIYKIQVCPLGFPLRTACYFVPCQRSSYKQPKKKLISVRLSTYHIIFFKTVHVVLLLRINLNRLHWLGTKIHLSGICCPLLPRITLDTSILTITVTMSAGKRYSPNIFFLIQNHTEHSAMAPKKG